MSAFEASGWTVTKTSITPAVIEDLRATAFSADAPGQRCLLDQPAVRDAALSLRRGLIDAGFLPSSAVALQAIAFDKNPTTNWKVTWHQDVMFPFAKPVSEPGYSLSRVKDDIAYARPPRHVLEAMLAVRLHLDDCDAENGPLRVATASHLSGILRSDEISRVISKHAEALCLARVGEALVMRPLLLHASSTATNPRHRRVLHIVYHTGDAVTEPWHRSLRD
jgi:ectoine hydroxylase-related dioxygenase (phytanoyl-CoA dioxygenase family)